MSHRPRSLKHEYELYVEREIEDYKESVSRNVLLSIGDEAVASLAAEQQLALTELLLCAEVDRLIRTRLRLPSYVTWRRRRLKALEEFRRPERWGLSPTGALVRAVPSDGHVLVAGASREGPALYLAANGCAVTALDATADVLDRVMSAAVEVGLSGRIRGLIADLSHWTPDMPLTAVVCAQSAFNGLTNADRARAIDLLQQATTTGGVHLVETMVDGAAAPGLDELRGSYHGWQTAVEGDGATQTFLAWKAVA